MGESEVTKRLKPVIMGVIDTKTRQLKGGPDLAALPSKVQKGRRPVNRKPEKFSLPLPVVASLTAVVSGSGLGAVHPSSLMRHIGWAAALIGIAALLISLTRMLWIVLNDRRTDYYSRQAFEALRAADEPVNAAVDLGEWRREFNG